jgi:hypothetical protein
LSLARILRPVSSGAIAFACCLAGFAMPAAACVNTFESEILRYQAEGDEGGVAGEMVKLESDYEKNPSLEHTNDLAVGRLLTRRYADAIELLNDAEMRFPGKAIVATNLGTAHELSGNLAEALRWISEGVRRDPKQHALNLTCTNRSREAPLSRSSTSRHGEALFGRGSCWRACS